MTTPPVGQYSAIMPDVKPPEPVLAELQPFINTFELLFT
jgi:hypothetical protein